MTEPAVVRLRVGETLWLEGQFWEICALETGVAVIRGGSEVRRVSLNYLSARVPVNGDHQVAVPDPPSLQLSKLGASERGAVDSFVAALQDIGDRAALGEKISALYEEKAAELGCSVRTLQRKYKSFVETGAGGLIDGRALRSHPGQVDPRWIEAARLELAGYRDLSTPGKNSVLRRIRERLAVEHGTGVVKEPSQASGYRLIGELSKGKYTFGSGKSRRSAAERPQGVFGRLITDGPGDGLLLDTPPLDVFAMEPITGQWVPVELTIAMDLYSRSITGLRLMPVSTKSVDVANVLFQTVSCDVEDDGELLGGSLPSCVPRTILVDHGKQYLSAHVAGACVRFGIGIQPALVHKPTD